MSLARRLSARARLRRAGAALLATGLVAIASPPAAATTTAEEVVVAAATR